MKRGVSTEQLNWEQYQKDFAALAEIGQNNTGGVDRLAYTEADSRHTAGWRKAEEAGFEVKGRRRKLMDSPGRGTDDGNEKAAADSGFSHGQCA